MTKFETLRDLIAQELGIAPEKITLESKMVDDLGADSLNVVEMIMAFEEEFGVTLPDEELEKIETVGDIVDALEKMDK